MKLSKICTLTAVIVGISIIMAPTAQAISISQGVEKITEYISKKGAGKVCVKGNWKNKIISIRSFNGLLCGATPSLAGLAVASCYENNKQDFRKSKCYKKAKGKLKIEDGMTTAQIIKIAQDAMVKDIKNVTSAVSRMACQKSGSLPGVAGETATKNCPS